MTISIIEEESGLKVLSSYLLQLHLPYRNFDLIAVFP